MKTTCLLFAFILFTTTQLFGQGWRIAPTVGFNVVSVTYSNALRNSMNTGATTISPGASVRFQVGALVDYAFSDRFSIRSGLLYTNKGGSLRNTETQYGITQTARANLELSYLEIPLLFKIAIGQNKLRLVAGPVLGGALGGKYVIASGSYYGYGYFGGSTSTMKVGTDVNSSLMPIDLSVSLGLVKELEVADRPLEIGLHVQPSFSNWTTISRTVPENYARNLLVGLRIAYLLELSR